MTADSSRTKRTHPARVKVRLSNPLDELLSREGKLPRTQIRSLVVQADVDDGPVWSVIPRRIVRQLGLATHESWIGRQAFGVKFEIRGRTPSDSTLIGGRKVLVGRTVLMGADWVIDPLRGHVVPNPKDLDGPVFRV